MATKKQVSTLSPELTKQTAEFFKGEARHNRDVKEPRGQRGQVYRRVFAKVTKSDAITNDDGDTVYHHTWLQQRWNYSKGKWEDAPDGSSGNKSVNYLVAFPDASIELPTDTILEVSLSEDPETGENIWLGTLASSLPTGQYQHQALYMVSQNQSGWSYLLAHPMVSDEEDDEGGI